LPTVCTQHARLPFSFLEICRSERAVAADARHGVLRSLRGRMFLTTSSTRKNRCGSSGPTVDFSRELVSARSVEACRLLACFVVVLRSSHSWRRRGARVTSSALSCRAWRSRSASSFLPTTRGHKGNRAGASVADVALCRVLVYVTAGRLAMARPHRILSHSCGRRSSGVTDGAHVRRPTGEPDRFSHMLPLLLPLYPFRSDGASIVIRAVRLCLVASSVGRLCVSPADEGVAASFPRVVVDLIKRDLLARRADVSASNRKYRSPAFSRASGIFSRDALFLASATSRR